MDEKKVKLYKQLVQTYQNLSLQKQAIAVELAETEKALAELENHGGKVYKSLGSVLIEADREASIKELKDRKEELGIKLESLERNIATVEQRLEKLRKELSE